MKPLGMATAVFIIAREKGRRVMRKRGDISTTRPGRSECNNTSLDPSRRSAVIAAAEKFFRLSSKPK